MSSPREQELERIVQEQGKMIDLLRQKVDFLLRRKYGVSSEKVSAEQVELGMALGEKPKEERDSTFTDWVNKASHTNGLQNQKHEASSFPFAEVVVDTSASDSLRSSPGTCVHLPGQAWVELDGKPEQAQHIAQLLKALQSS